MKVNFLDSRKVRSSWLTWATSLSKYGLDDLAAWFLESFGSLRILGSQLLHFSEPFLKSTSMEDSYRDLLILLEDPAESQAFIDYLKGQSEL